MRQQSENTQYRWHMFLCVKVMQLFSFQIDMAEPILTQQMKRHAVIVSWTAGHTDSEIAAFLKVD